MCVICTNIQMYKGYLLRNKTHFGLLPSKRPQTSYISHSLIDSRNPSHKKKIIVQ